MIAAVKALLAQTSPQRIIVLSPQRGAQAAGYERVASLAQAAQRVPFDILVPPADRGWRLVTVMVAESARMPGVELLYRAPADTWVKISERPSSAATSAGDAEIGDLVQAGQGAPKTIGGVIVTVTPPLRARSYTVVLHGLRATITASGASKAVDGALATPLRPMSSVPSRSVRVTTSPAR